MEELCHYELINVTHVKDEVRGNRANIYRFLWHPWMQLKEDKDYALVKVDFDRPPSDINVTTPGDTRVTSPSVKNVTQKRIIYEERGREEANQTLHINQLPPPQKVFKGKLNDIQNADPWESAKDAVENFKQQKLYPREWDNIISEVSKLSLCTTGEEALALKWYSKAAKAASLGLPLPFQQQQRLDALPVQEKATMALTEQPKIKKSAFNSQAEEKWLAVADILQTQIPQEAYQRWFNGIVAKQLDGNCLFLAVPNRVYQSWIENNYRKEIKEASEKLKVKIFYKTYENSE